MTLLFIKILLIKFLFIYIYTDLFVDTLKTNESGYLVTAADTTVTNIDGIFACGDVQDHSYRQAITAAGTGCMSAIDAERYLENNS